MKKSRVSSARNSKVRRVEMKLTSSNYKEYFCKLLSSDEQSAEINLRQFNMEKITVIMRVDSLEVKVPGLAEKRPSIIRGDTVTLKEHDSGLESTGVVKEIHDKAISIHQIANEFKSVVRVNPECLIDVKFNLQRLSYNRKYVALNMCSLEEIESILMPTRQKSEPNNKTQRFRLTDDKFINTAVGDNPQQRQAVTNILNGTSGRAPYILFGPPGTGKSVTIVEAIIQLVRHIPTCTVLVCAPTNAACDVLVEKLSKHFGRYENMLIRIYSQSADWKTVPQIVKYYSNRSELVHRKISGRALQKFRVIVTTLISIGHYAKLFTATHVFIDEAAQATEPEALVAIAGILSKDGQLVLSGDPHQLGPVNNSDDPALSKSLLARLMERPMYKNTDQDAHLFTTKLVLNYRNHPNILRLPNHLFYNSDLVAASDLAIHDQINQVMLPMGAGQRVKAQAVEFYGVEGCEAREASSPSFYNEQEVDIVIEYLESLTDPRAEVAVQPEEIGVIAPYSKQVAKIRSRLRDEWKNIEIGTTEIFQGREKRVIIISTVRGQANDVSGIGFVRSPKRFNVAITRAISKLIIIGNPHSLASSVMWLKMIKFCQAMDSYRGCPFERPANTSLDYKIICCGVLSFLLVGAAVVMHFKQY